MKVISISTFVALAALVQSSSALWCDCYLRFSHGESTLFDQYDAELSQKCCKDVMDDDLMTGGFLGLGPSRGYCDAGSQGEEYMNCCATSGKKAYGYCK
jgi:hypothetical protein